jgi:hypothetical protein
MLDPVQNKSDSNPLLPVRVPTQLTGFAKQRYLWCSDLTAGITLLSTFYHG